MYSSPSRPPTTPFVRCNDHCVAEVYDRLTECLTGDALSDRPLILACVGALSASSAAADVLDGVLALAEAYPSREFLIRWIGAGDMRGVLTAQPLPGNLKQHFWGEFLASDLGPALVEVDAVYLLDPNLRALEAMQGADIPVIVDAARVLGSMRQRPSWRGLPMGQGGFGAAVGAFRRILEIVPGRIFASRSASLKPGIENA